MPEELYGIDLSPGGGVPSVPGGAKPNGSIGGSDVGANEQDDQRVRDLVEQRVEELNIVNNIKVLQAAGGGVPSLLGGWHNTNENGILVNADGVSAELYAGLNERAIVLTGNPILVQFFASYYIFYTPNATGADPGISLLQYMMLDNKFIGFCQETQTEEVDASVAHGYTFRFSMFGQAVLKPGVAVNSLGTSAAAVTTILAAGSHQFRLDHELTTDLVSAGTLDFAVMQESVLVYDLGAGDLVTVT